MSPLDLPNEILLAIISHASKATLTQLLLVSKRLCVLTEPFLYRDVDLTNDLRMVELFNAKVSGDMDNQHLSARVHSLRVSHVARVHSVFPSLVNLGRLAATSAHDLFVLPPDFYTVALNSISGLTHIEWLHHPGNIPAFFQFVTSQRSLRYLRFLCLSQPWPYSDIERASIPSDSLQCLQTLVTRPQLVDKLLPGRTIRHLDIDSEGVHISNNIVKFSTPLESLRIGMNGIHILNDGEFLNIQYLEIYAINNVLSLEELVGHIQRFPWEELECVQYVMSTGALRGPKLPLSSQTVQRLDHFPKLRRLRVIEKLRVSESRGSSASNTAHFSFFPNNGHKPLMSPPVNVD
ncbi:hypothetical protein ONZ45_g13181 [Pleurotus djamor]|nr:hypothetical protein ONZ45_g13181 [Pleurotus djamor]